MKEITVTELNALKTKHADFQLIDVREDHEVEIATIGGENIPMGEIMDSLDKVSKTKQVIVHCKSGKRSAAVCQFLINEGFENIYNLKGGILAWADEIDTTLTKY